jgi:hypothetical protein
MKRLAIFLFCWSLPASVFALTVEGKKFEPTTTVSGKRLELIGAGLRRKAFFDVYALAAYTESGTCDTTKIIQNEEVKYLRIEMLRSVKAKTMASAIGDSFNDAIPPNADPKLESQSETFKSYFENSADKNQVIDFTYVPEVGVTIRQDGRQLGPPLTGKEFQEVFWSIYFGSKTSLTELREQILQSCK